MFERIRIPVEMCCNDPKNGLFTNRVAGIDVGSNMTFEAKGREPALRHISRAGKTERIAIAGKQFPILGWKEWTGNWCWNRYWLCGNSVLVLLNWPRLRKTFDLTEGEDRLRNWWESGRTWTDDDLRLISKRFT